MLRLGSIALIVVGIVGLEMAGSRVQADVTSQTGPASRRSTRIALLVAAAFFMENLDGTVIATALPQMAATFGTDAVDLNIGMTAYMLALAIFIPVSGWVADRFGPRTVFAAAIALFTLSSILCGSARGLHSFTAFRILQGLGGAMMVPVGRLVVLRTTEKAQLLRSMAYITWPGLAAPIVGPPVGGFITTYFSWPWIFYLNIPLGIAGLILALLLLENGRSDTRRPLDILGFLLSGSACTALIYGLELAGRVPTPTAEAAAFILAGLGSGVLAVRHLLRHPAPLIDMQPIRIRTFSIVVYGGSLLRIAISTAPFLLPLMFQVGFGLDAFTAGMLVLAMFAGNLSMKSVANGLLRHFGFRTVLLANGVITALTLLACGMLTPGMPYALIAAVLFVSGLCRSLQFSAISTLSFADVPKPLMSAASTLFSVLSQLTLGMGVAVGALALRLAHLLDPVAPEPTLFDFRLAFAFTAVLCLVALAGCWTLPRDAGAAVSGHRPRPRASP